MLAVPPLTPLTKPVADTVAILVLLLLQVPPEVASVNLTVVPVQIGELVSIDAIDRIAGLGHRIILCSRRRASLIMGPISANSEGIPGINAGQDRCG